MSCDAGMDLDQLVGRLRFHAERAGPKPNGPLMAQAADALEKLMAENERLKREDQGWKALYEGLVSDVRVHDVCEICAYVGDKPDCGVDCETCTITCLCSGCKSASNFRYKLEAESGCSGDSCAIGGPDAEEEVNDE